MVLPPLKSLKEVKEPALLCYITIEPEARPRPSNCFRSAKSSFKLLHPSSKGREASLNVTVESQRRGHTLAGRHRVHAAATVAVGSILEARLVVEPIHRLLAVGPEVVAGGAPGSLRQAMESTRIRPL